VVRTVGCLSQDAWKRALNDREVGQHPSTRLAVRYARLVRERTTPFRTGAPIATGAAPARCGAFADERRIVGGDVGGRARMRNAPPLPVDLKAQRCVPTCRHPACPPASGDRSSASVASPVASFDAGVREPALERMTGLYTGVPIATIRCVAPACCRALWRVRR